ncbi:hypothetical protein WICPIJ_003581 [Wickerhamomyces pijperi]|uniref:TEA domain-containing protein n=1 Tax=Wickerhamomyces pijperi TaxID=599730 RepID=A0A9P8Q7N3_WICPI|nr:hypothetical protein WICPIJ_003581 [Wickerhamomyces pijperi]
MTELLPSVHIESSSLGAPAASSHRGKPMVVDISVDAKGTQTFKVHDSRASRKRKRYSIDTEDAQEDKATATATENASSQATDSQNITPSRSILRSISPRSLNENTTSEPSNKLCKRSEDDSPCLQRSECVNDDNIWSSDVEAAFEEALKMIPKNGLTKIKISGKSCGRNELISDYILQTTGKFRTRKQVSSHIQVIKNLKRNTKLIDLINDGPSDDESLKKFDVVFSEIQFKKSLGAAGVSSIAANIQRIPTPLSLDKPKSRRLSPTASSRPKTPSTAASAASTLKPIECQLREFEMALVDKSAGKLHKFSSLLDRKLGQDLRLKPDASISHRFPNLNEYSKKKADRESRRAASSAASAVNKDSNQPPILHNMVQLDIPTVVDLSRASPATDLKLFMKNIPLGDTEKEEEFSYLKLFMKNIPLGGDTEKEEEFSCLTTVYSFGAEFIKLIEGNLEVEKRLENNYYPSELQNIVVKVPFAPEFWSAFLTSLGQASSTASQRTIAVKSTTIEQVIYRKGSKPSELNKSDIKAMILWEFNINEDSSKPAETTTRRLFLPNVTPSASFSTASILEKSVEPLSQPAALVLPQTGDELVETEDDEQHFASDSTFDSKSYQPPNQHQHQQHQQQQLPMTPSSIQKTLSHPQVQMASQLHQQLSSPSFSQSRNNSLPVNYSNSNQNQFIKRAQSDGVLWGSIDSSQQFNQVPVQVPVSLSSATPYSFQQHSLQNNTPHPIHFSGYNSDEFTSFQHQPIQEQVIHSNDLFHNGFVNSSGQMDMLHQFTDVNMHTFPTW